MPCLQKLKKPLIVGDSCRQTYEQLKQGKTPVEIAKERNLAETTIYAHFAMLIAAGQISSLDVVSEDTDKKVREAAKRFRTPSMKEIKEVLPDVSYEEIRCVLAGIKPDN